MGLPYHQRTHTNGELRGEHAGQEVLLVGWVANCRDHGGMTFVDLRDRAGITQLKFDPKTDADLYRRGRALRSEDCVAVRGRVISRGANVNPRMPTGEIEVEVIELDVLAKSHTPPLEVVDQVEATEELRLKYRFLDLRRRPMQQAMIQRHRITKAMRDYFDGQGFLDIETPFLTKSTPEGARDYLVPSRIHQGRFYALPQSPQLFKQLLMIAGFDRYMQIVRCFRDEDLRADRQPEFTQVDVEMAFVQAEDVMRVVEGAFAHVFREVRGVAIPLPMPRIPYDLAMREYGVDKPDLRYGMKILDVSALAGRTEFAVFREALGKGGVVRAICCPGAASLTRKQTDALASDLRGIGAGGLPLVKVTDEGGKLVLSTGVAKFFADPELAGELIAAAAANVGDTIFFAADSEANVCKHLGWLRTTLAARMSLIPPDRYEFCWVVDFPLFGKDPETGDIFSMHHPFTSPLDEDLDRLESDPLGVRAKAYDVVLNGIELGGGSIRIHRQDVQQRVFRLLGISEEQARLKFQFLLEALRYGAPPHGGIALGLDRIVMLMVGFDSIRDTIAFPKTTRAACLLTDAPSLVSPQQLDELGLDLSPKVKARLAEAPGE